jgi:EmrB/QacA subfamily drug resistance transporter
MSIPWSSWRLAMVIAFGAFMSGLDASVVNVGLARIAHDLDAGIGDAQWVANGYLLALGVSLPACGWLGRRVGVGRLWLWSLAAFTLASGLCALPRDVGWLIALRVVQGLSAGLLIPAGQTIIGRAVGPQRLGQVMATLGIAVALAPALGPVVGALVLEASSWPWLFLVNVPVGGVALALGWRYVPRGERSDVGRLDWLGLLLLSAGLPLVVYGCTAWGERHSVAASAVLAPLAGGVVALIAYGLRGVRRTDPILDLRLFGNRAYAAASATTAFTSAAMFGAMLLFPLYFQIGRGESVLATGLSLVSLGIGTAIMLPLGGRLVDRVGGGVVSCVGGLAALVTTLPFALLDVHAPLVVIQALLLVRGTAIALAAMPAVTAAYKAVSAEQLPDATTQVNVLMRVGGALGGSVFAVVLASRLPDGAEAAFHASFWWLTAASALGLGGAAWLAAAERRGGRERAPVAEPATR